MIIETARGQEMSRMRHEKLMSLQEIANQFGITHERVRQIIGNTGKEILKMRKTKRDASLRNATWKTNAQLVAETGLSEWVISNARKGTHHAVEPNSMIGRGQEAEHYVSNKLNELDIENDLMPIGHSFDILIKNGLRIDVKHARKTVKTRPTIRSPQYHFADKKNGKDCDYFVCVIWETKDCYIIPAHLMKAHLYICLPSLRPELAKYSQYLNAWELLR